MYKYKEINNICEINSREGCKFWWEYSECRNTCTYIILTNTTYMETFITCLSYRLCNTQVSLILKALIQNIIQFSNWLIFRFHLCYKLTNLG